MRLRICTALALLIAALAASTQVQGHLVVKPKDGSIQARLASQTENLAHARYVCARGAGTHRAWSCNAVVWLNRERQETLVQLVPKYGVEEAICATFGPYCSQALRVASCESGHSIYARNGQYLGLFQMGDYARSTYGHGYTPIEQARAAYRYFVASGRDWSPWSCKP